MHCVNIDILAQGQWVASKLRAGGYRATCAVCGAICRTAEISPEGGERDHASVARPHTLHSPHRFMLEAGLQRHQIGC